MINLKNLYLLLIFSFIFTNCSAAQEKPSPELPTKTTESSDKVNPETKRFESKAGNFSINISQEPMQTQNINQGKGEDIIKLFLWKFEKTLYTIAFSEFNKNEVSQSFDDMNNGTRKAIGRAGSQLISEKEISFDKYSGREFIYVAQNGVKYVGRNYLVKTMGYQIVAGYVDEKSEKEALEVLDSFRLLSEKK